MTVPVDIYALSDELVPQPIPGVVIALFDPAASFAPAGSGTTDSAGKASFVLPGAVAGRNYEVRFFKLGVLFGTARSISVLEPATSPNVFEAPGHIYTRPVATDPRVCRCTGRFMDLRNKPLADVLLMIRQKADSGFQTPKVVDGNLIAASDGYMKTDRDGYVTYDLIRGGEYYVSFAGEDDVVWNIKVPDRLSANLIDLIHPQPVSLAWDPSDAPGNAVSVPVGYQVCIPMTVLFSDYEELSTGLSKWIRLLSTDTAVCTVAFGEDRAVIRGLAPGTAEVHATVVDGLLPSRVPSYSLTAPPLSVTVSS